MLPGANAADGEGPMLGEKALELGNLGVAAGVALASIACAKASMGSRTRGS